MMTKRIETLLVAIAVAVGAIAEVDVGARDGGSSAEHFAGFTGFSPINVGTAPIGGGGGGGVTSAVAGTGISVSGATGAVTFTNTGVTSCTGGGGITCSAATGAVTLGSQPSTILDALANTNGSILTRTAGTWAAIANLATANGALLSTAQTTPSAPSAGTAQIYTTTKNGRVELATLGPAGQQSEMQPLMGTHHTYFWGALAGATGSTVWGFPTLAITGTATARTPASTNLATSLARLGSVSSAGAGSVAGFRGAADLFWLGNGAGLGGFMCVSRFEASDASLVTTANMFVGMQAATGAPTDVVPSGLTNILGVGCNNGDTHLQLYAAGGVAQARVDLGANFPVNTVSTDVYEFMLYAPPNASSVTYRVTRLNTGNVATGTLSGANIPASTQFLTHNWYRSNGGTATAVGLDMISNYCETDY